MSEHLSLRERLEQRYAAELTGRVELKQDALLLQLRNGVAIELRFPGQEEYAVNWRWGDAELRIDTAPLHPELPTFPNHLHDADGVLRADWLTRPRRDAWDNVCALLDALLADPLLRSQPHRA